MLHQTFATITRGLQRSSPPMRLYEKAKRLGIWNPSEIDFRQDLHDWQAMDDLERDVLLRLTTMFQAGEEAVTLDLLPLVMVIAQGGRLEEELFLTTFLFEEGEHTDFFRRFLDEVAGSPKTVIQRCSFSHAAEAHPPSSAWCNRAADSPAHAPPVPAPPSGRDA